MNLKTTRLDDKLNGILLGTVFAIVISIGSAFVSVEGDATMSAQAPATSQVVASTTPVAVH